MDDIYQKSLEELDGQRWGSPPADATGLVERVHRLRKVKLSELAIEDIATLIGQREGEQWLVPLALDYLARDPLAEGLYPGQLLMSLLRLTDYWTRFPQDLGRLWAIRADLLRRRANIDKLLSDPGWP